MPRIEVTAEDAAEIARLCYLLKPGRVLTRAEAVRQILEEWRAAKQVERANRAEVAKPP